MDSLGKNTGKKESEVPQLRLTLWPPWTIDYQAPLLIEFSRQEHWSRLPFPSPGDLPEPGLNPDFLNCRQMLYHLSHPGKEVAISSSRGSSWPRNWTHVSCVSWIGWQILYHYITWEAPPRQMGYYNKFIILSPRFKKSWGGGSIFLAIAQSSHSVTSRINPSARPRGPASSMPRISPLFSIPALPSPFAKFKERLTNLHLNILKL